MTVPNILKYHPIIYILKINSKFYKRSLNYYDLNFKNKIIKQFKIQIISSDLCRSRNCVIYLSIKKKFFSD